MKKLTFAARLWYYFRVGYATYLTFLLGVLNTTVVVWYLAIREVPTIENIFGHFLPFAIFVVAVGIPSSICIGWIHLKRSPAYQSELDIGVEANPYYYKMPPGYNREVLAPLYLEVLTELKRLLEAQNLLGDEQRARIEGLEHKLQILIQGGRVGTPRTRI